MSATTSKLPAPRTAASEAREVFLNDPELIYDKEVNEILDRWQRDKDELYELKRSIEKGLFEKKTVINVNIDTLIKEIKGNGFAVVNEEMVKQNLIQVVRDAEASLNLKGGE